MMSSFPIGLLLLLVISLASAEKICPGYGFVRRPENCTSTCSTSDDRCSTDTKCCYRITEPCGFHCIVPKDNVKKSGQCLNSQMNNSLWYLCDVHICDVDNDCQGIEKCCSNSCGSKICITPS